MNRIKKAVSEVVPNIPASEHSVWIFLRMLVMVLGLAVMLEYNYASGFQAKVDIPTILGMIALIGGYDSVKKAIIPSGKEKEGNDADGPAEKN